MFFIQSSLKSYFYILGKRGELVWSSDYNIYGRLKNVKANGLSNQKWASPNSMRLSEKNKTFKLDKNRTPVYKEDYLKDENGIIYEHSQLPNSHIHKTNPHINILTSEGNKVSINILK